MGCDGGSIPKRGDLVKTKQKHANLDDDHAKADRAATCAISQQLLEPPNVSCPLGELYNKDAVLQHLLTPAQDRIARFAHITSIRDVFDVNIKFKDGKGVFYCPVSLTEANGKYKFSVIRPCGCVVLDKLLENSQLGAKQCPNCAKDTESIVGLWPSEIEREERLANFLAAKKAKKDKKRKKPEESKNVEEIEVGGKK
jgi:hypothetical protein